MTVKVVLAAAAMAATISTASMAQNLAPPAGAILDLAAVQTTVTQPYRQYTVSFTAAQSSTFVSFLFRRDPSYFGFDDASVTLFGGGTNLLSDPGFESASLGTAVPAGWGNFQQIGGLTATGVVASGGGRGGTGAHSGTQFWDDGTVGGYDGLYQQLATQVGSQYTVSFWLANPNGTSTYSQTGTGIDVLVYAGAALPDGTVVTNPAPPPPPPTGVPEPASFAVLGAGLLGLSLVRRRLI